ncbi:MAG: NAD(P)/FAD-dependent oxidoreductase [Sphingosinicella sp.]
MPESEYLIVGGGVAGLSAGARLAEHGRVAVLEAEEALGFHSSGRSATFSHFGIGNRVVRALTVHSRAFFLAAGEGALCRPSPAMFIATPDMVPALDALQRDMAPFTHRVRDIGRDEMAELFPPLRIEAIEKAIVQQDGLRLDSDAMLQNFARTIREAGGEVLTGARAMQVEGGDGGWTITTANGERRSGRILVNAAGAWADAIAVLAGVAPLGLKPLRRTIIVVDPPDGADVRDWPFVKTATDDFYILPESGRLMASPVDEVESDACDAQPEEYDVALAAWKVERYTTLPLARIAHRWAGLRTFTADRTPAVGFDPQQPAFFWLAGQGGFGLQTAPALSEAAAAIATGGEWPPALAALGVAAADIDPRRLIGA